MTEPRLTDRECAWIARIMQHQGVDSADEGMGTFLFLAQLPPNEVRATYGLPIPVPLAA